MCTHMYTHVYIQMHTPQQHIPCRQWCALPRTWPSSPDAAWHQGLPRAKTPPKSHPTVCEGVCHGGVCYGCTYRVYRVPPQGSDQYQQYCYAVPTTTIKVPWQTRAGRPGCAAGVPDAGQQHGCGGVCQQGPCSHAAVQLQAMPRQKNGIGDKFAQIIVLPGISIATCGVACTHLAASKAKKASRFCATTHLQHCAGGCGDHAGAAWCSGQGASGGCHVDL